MQRPSENLRHGPDAARRLASPGLVRGRTVARSGLGAITNILGSDE